MEKFDQADDALSLIENGKEVIEPVYRMVGAKIAMTRELLGWSQETLAEKIGMSRPNLVNIEVGRQRVMMHQVEGFALAFGMSIQHFMRGIWFQDGRKKQ